MVAFPGTEREWFAELRISARQEVARLRRSGWTMEDEEDAIQWMIVAAYLHITRLTWKPRSVFGLAQFVMRQRVRGQYIAAQRAQKRGGRYVTTSLDEIKEWVEDHDETDEAKLLPSTDPWPEVEDAITLRTLEARRTNDTQHEQRTDITRQGFYERRQRLLQHALRNKRPHD